MESLARPPHRRKHSAITNTFSFKNPYDDVLLFNGGGKKKSFEASEYAEIFSGSSSIPVIDLPGLDDRVGFGSGDPRSSKLEYSSIFGGLENDDVAVPYDELFNGSAKKTKPRIPANVPPPQQESVPPHPSRNKRRSSSDVPDKFYPKKDVPDKSADGVNQHFNMSFNKTSQRNNDETNGKTHIAEFHAVPGFTYFVDGAPHKQKPEVGPTPPPLKREVSRTWSFSAEFESLKGKGGSSYDKSHTPEKLQKVDEANLQSNFSKFPPSSRCSSNLSDDKDSVQSRVNSFAFKEDASGKIAGECSFDEEFDENSVAAVSAAALKKAIDQAQESIRIAKMIMERKRESHLDGSEPKLSGGMKVPGKKSKIVRGNGSKEKKCEELDAIFNLFTGIDGKLALPLGRSDPLISAGNAAVERVRENVEMGKFYKVEKEKVRENVEEAEMRRETTDFPGFAANVECGTANLRICQEDEVIEERENDMDDNGKCEEKSEECEEMHNMEDWTVLRSALDDSVNESCNLVGNEMLEQEKVEKESENVTESKENGETHGKNCDEEESGMRENEIQLKETLEEEVNERETNVFPEIREVEEKINEVHEPEIDVNKHNHASDGDEPRLSEEVVQNSVEERHIITSEYESAKTMMMEANNYAEVQKGAAFCDADEINNCFIDNNNNSDNSKGPTIFIEARANDTNTIFNETEETRGVESNNKAEEYNYNNNIISISKLDDNEMPGMVSLRRTTSEETFIESELHNAFENLSFGENGENIDIIDSDSEEKPPGDDGGASRTTSEIHDNTAPEFDLSNVRQVLEQTSESGEGSVSTHENSDVSSAHDSEESPENAIEEKENELEMVSDERKHPEEHTEPKEMEKSSENSEGAEKNKEIEDHQQRVEAIKKRREREKDRKAVERAIREARERAFAEARERAERAAVEKAAAEVRQRAMAEAREKATVGKQAADKASVEAKLRAERAAVERATAEARQRALEKAKSLKTTESISTSSRSNGLKHSFSSSDLENGTSTESAQRRKARLERHQRIMERAAKALEEKNMRDSLAQKEQAERNRLAESLDADIKRWATGKEGNLRALLSTLQYILGSESGWQPISLTEIITTPAVKKAYRKATLYVHPDKLQQRGASIQQKYICEKVFDLLKAAWNRFNSEER